MDYTLFGGSVTDNLNKIVKLLDIIYSSADEEYKKKLDMYSDKFKHVFVPYDSDKLQSAEDVNNMLLNMKTKLEKKLDNSTSANPIVTQGVSEYNIYDMIDLKGIVQMYQDTVTNEKVVKTVLLENKDNNKVLVGFNDQLTTTTQKLQININNAKPIISQLARLYDALRQSEFNETYYTVEYVNLSDTIDEPNTNGTGFSPNGIAGEELLLLEIKYNTEKKKKDNLDLVRKDISTYKRKLQELKDKFKELPSEQFFKEYKILLDKSVENMKVFDDIQIEETSASKDVKQLLDNLQNVKVENRHMDDDKNTIKTMSRDKKNEHYKKEIDRWMFHLNKQKKHDDKVQNVLRPFIRDQIANNMHNNGDRIKEIIKNNHIIGSYYDIENIIKDIKHEIFLQDVEGIINKYKNIKNTNNASSFITIRNINIANVIYYILLQTELSKLGNARIDDDYIQMIVSLKESIKQIDETHIAIKKLKNNVDTKYKVFYFDKVDVTANVQKLQEAISDVSSISDQRVEMNDLKENIKIAEDDRTYEETTNNLSRLEKQIANTKEQNKGTDATKKKEYNVIYDKFKQQYFHIDTELTKVFKIDTKVELNMIMFDAYKLAQVQTGGRDFPNYKEFLEYLETQDELKTSLLTNIRTFSQTTDELKFVLTRVLELSEQYLSLNRKLCLYYIYELLVLKQSFKNNDSDIVCNKIISKQEIEDMMVYLNEALNKVSANTTKKEIFFNTYHSYTINRAIRCLDNINKLLKLTGKTYVNVFRTKEPIITDIKVSYHIYKILFDSFKDIV